MLLTIILIIIISSYGPPSLPNIFYKTIRRIFQISRKTKDLYHKAGPIIVSVGALDVKNAFNPA